MFEGDTVMSVGTCPSCLPVGAISWLIENGRQLELFGEEGVSPCKGRETIENDSSIEVERGLQGGPGDLPF